MRGNPPRPPRAVSPAPPGGPRPALSASALCICSLCSAGSAGALSFASAGCNEAGQSSGAKAPTSARSEVFDHEACDATGDHVQAIDTNADGKPDLYRVFDRAPGDKDAHEVCRVVDLNHDGRPDLYEYFDGSGAIRRREFCYDDTGVVNAIESYKAGKLTERVYDTTGQHKIDTWDWFDAAAPVDAKTGRPSHPVRRERDIRGDGTVNQWWTWTGDQVSIATDRNGDGQPDPDSVIVLGGDGGTTEAPGSEPASSTLSPEAGGPPEAPAPGQGTTEDAGHADGAAS